MEISLEKENVSPEIINVGLICLSNGIILILNLNVCSFLKFSIDLICVPECRKVILSSVSNIDILKSYIGKFDMFFNIIEHIYCSSNEMLQTTQFWFLINGIDKYESLLLHQKQSCGLSSINGTQ